MTTPDASTAAGSITPADLAGLLATFNDVTSKLQSAHDSLRNEVARLTRELHEANEQVERSKRLAALGEMAAGIAHEVRNPLGSIRLYATMLEEDLAGVPKQAATAAKITSAARVVENIVGDVLSFARELKLRFEPVAPSDLFDRVFTLCEHERTKVTNLELVRSCGKSELTCDAALLSQALVNIVHNAMQAMSSTRADSHRLELSCTRIRAALGTKSRIPAMRLRVRDTGPGVTPDTIARMFNPFFTTRSTGTGLGLSIVHRIIDAHGGRIEVRNNADLATELNDAERGALGPFASRGACIDCLLPLEPTADASQRHMRDASASVSAPAPTPEVHILGANSARELTNSDPFGRK
jgi:signal transduction histidine kinase